MATFILDTDSEILTTVRTALEKLVANGGGTVQGVADELERQGVRGVPGAVGACVIAEYVKQSLPEGWIGGVFPTVCGPQPLVRVFRRAFDEVGYVELPDVLNALALHFDNSEFLALLRPLETHYRAGVIVSAG